MTSEARRAGQARIASTLSDKRLAKLDRIKKMNSETVKSLRRPALLELYDRLIDNTQVETAKLAGVVIMGESGSGKTHLVRSLETLEAFQPYYEDGIQEPMLPYISIDAPPKAAPNHLIAAIIRACGLNITSVDSTAAMLVLAWRLFEKRRVFFVHIDEFQHALRSSTEKQIKEIQDTIKEMIQITAPWPIQIILSGTPNLDLFRLSNEELRTRTLPFNLESVQAEGNLKLVLVIVEGVILQHAKLTCDTLLKDARRLTPPEEKKITNELQNPWVAANADFALKVLKAANYQFGNIIQIVRLACERVIHTDREDVTMADFAAVYTLLVGEADSERNMFAALNWRHLEIPQAIIDGKAFVKVNRKTNKAKLFKA